MKDLIKYSKRHGVYISSYDLAKATGKKHQNLITSIKREYKFYIPYQIQNHRYYKKQKIYLLTRGVIRTINKNGVYDDLLEAMEEVHKEKSQAMYKAMETFFNKFK